MRTTTTETDSRRSRIGLAVTGTLILLATVVGVSYATVVPNTPVQDPKELLDCTEGSDYTVGMPPLYIDGVTTEESPAELSQRYAAEAALNTNAGQPGAVHQQTIYESPERVEIAFATADDRVIAILFMDNENGWKSAGSIACASW